MFCGKCGTDNPEGNMFCNKCGAPIGSQAPVTQVAQPVQMQQPVYQGYNPNMYQQPVQKSGNKGLVIALISILVAVIIALICIILLVWKPFNKDDDDYDRSRGSSSSASGSSSSSGTSSFKFGGGEKKETGASSGMASATSAPAVEATAPPASYQQAEPVDLSVYGLPSDIFYIFFKGFLYNDPDTVYDCFPPFDKMDYYEVVEWCKQGEDWKYDFGYEVIDYHIYSDDELNDLIDRIYSETGYIANEIDEAAVVYTHYYLDEYEELDDEMIVIKISGRWYIYDLGKIDTYI